MRHVPSIDWMTWKVDTGLRGTIEKILRVFGAAGADDPRRGRLDEHLRYVCRTLDRLAGVAKPTRHNGQGDLPQRLDAALSHAAATLRSLDGDLIGRRFPFHTFERSKAEPLYGALLLVMQAVERALAEARELDPLLDEQLLGPLVVIQNRVDERMLRPIA
ncbi:MAG TPA: hypothetical protein VNA04_09555 [Thermoanaerobaculia bacterium]|nr:hypothetical protein [Thermoanaerobaculia bacterium]